MPTVIDLSSTSAVCLLDVNEDNVAVAYMGNQDIPIFSLETSKQIRKYEVASQLRGLHFTNQRKHVFYAIDDSFGLHTFDTRADSKKKHRLNPDSENHLVSCTAFSSNDEILAVASSEFGGGIMDVRGSRRRVNHPHVVSLYDVRMVGEPITSYYKRHKSTVTGMNFYMNGHDMLVGDNDGALISYDTRLRDEDNATRWERWVRGPVTKLGTINKRITYTISNRSEVTVFVEGKNKVLEVLYGCVNKTAEERFTTSKGFFKKPEFCAGVVKGLNDNRPLVALHGVDKKNFLSLTVMNVTGVREPTPLLSYRGHNGPVRCMTATKDLVLTGGDDGKVIVQLANFNNEKFGEDSIEHYRLTLNRGNLAELENSGQADSDEASSDSDTDNASSKASSSKPSSSSSSSSSKKIKLEKEKKGKQDKESKSTKEAKFKEPKQAKAKKEEVKSIKETKPAKEAKQAKETKPAKEAKPAKETKPAKEDKPAKGAKETKPSKESKEAKSPKKPEEPKVPKPPKVVEKPKETEGSEEEPKDSKVEAKETKKESKEKKDKKDQPSTSSSTAASTSTASSSSSSSRKETKEERRIRKEREAARDRERAAYRAAREKEREGKPFDEEREKRRLAKLAETPEQRAERKQKAREERERLEKEERKKKKREAGSEHGSSSKRAKHD